VTGASGTLSADYPRQYYRSITTQSLLQTFRQTSGRLIEKPLSGAETAAAAGAFRLALCQRFPQTSFYSLIDHFKGLLRQTCWQARHSSTRV